MLNFDVGDKERQGTLALPPSGRGPGLLYLHAWWGLNDFAKKQCERLAAEGFVVFAPDLHHGRLATTPEQAEKILNERDFDAAWVTAQAALTFLQQHPAVTGDKLAAMGFSMGTGFALMLDEHFPEAFSKIVLFYGGSGADVTNSKAHYLAHFAETDEFEPLEEVQKTKGPNLVKHIYPGTGHWFFESDRSAFDPAAAQTAWERSLVFLKE